MSKEEKPVPFAEYLNRVFGEEWRISLQEDLLNPKGEEINGIDASFEHLSLNVLLENLVDRELYDIVYSEEERQNRASSQLLDRLMGDKYKTEKEKRRLRFYELNEGHIIHDKRYIEDQIKSAIIDPQSISLRQEVFAELLNNEKLLEELIGIRETAIEYKRILCGDSRNIRFPLVYGTNFEPAYQLVKFFNQVSSLDNPNSTLLKQLKNFGETVSNDQRYNMLNIFIERYYEANNLGNVLDEILRSLNFEEISDMGHFIGTKDRNMENNRKFYANYRILQEVTEKMVNDPDLKDFLNIEIKETELVEKIKTNDFPEFFAESLKEERIKSTDALFSFDSKQTKEYFENGLEKTISLIKYWTLVVREAINYRIPSINLEDIAERIGFYVAFTNHFKNIKKRGYDVCKVKIAPKEDKTCIVENGINPVLIYTLEKGKKPIPNNIYSTKDENCFIITGPNNSGKSTYERQVGLTVLVGLLTGHAPAAKAKISIVDGIFASLSEKDDITRGDGQYASQLGSFNNMDEGKFGWTEDDKNHMTPYSLFISSEFGTGTAHKESIERTAAITRYLSLKGVTTYLATHNQEVAELLAKEGLEGFLNLCTESIPKQDDKIELTYKILRNQIGQSHGELLAKTYGLTEEGLLDRLKKQIAAGHFPKEATRLG